METYDPEEPIGSCTVLKTSPEVELMETITWVGLTT